MHTAESDRAPAAEPAARSAAPVAAPSGGAPAVLALQRSAGNRAVARLVGAMWRRARFRAAIGDDIREYGQMLFHARLEALLFPKLDEAVAAYPALQETIAYWKAALGRKQWAEAETYRKELENTRLPQSLLGDGKTSLEAGGAIFTKLWAELAKPDGKPPDVTPYLTLSQYQALRRFEFQACEATAKLVAKRFIATGGSGGDRSAGTAMGRTFLVGGVEQDGKADAKGMYRGSVATYSAGLGKEVERMKRALDDGWLIHARVLSGLEGGGEKRNTPEHSILVYGYAGDEFEYWDPDVGGSNIHTTGFDLLHFDRKSNRLSTARGDDDFAVYDKSGGALYGFQASGVHRYQAVSVETL